MAQPQDTWALGGVACLTVRGDIIFKIPLVQIVFREQGTRRLQCLNF